MLTSPLAALGAPADNEPPVCRGLGQKLQAQAGFMLAGWPRQLNTRIYSRSHFPVKAMQDL